MPDGPAFALGVVLKCAICLALLTLLVVAGGNQESNWAASETRGSAPHASTVWSGGTAAHRKEVFDERRAHFEGTESTPAKSLAVAEAPPDSPNEASCSGGVDGGMDASGNECNKGR